MKDELRKKYLKIRRNINGRKIKDEEIFNLVINNEYIKKAKLILIYVSFNNEVDTIKLINYFLKSKQVAVPKVADGKMSFYYIDSLTELKKGYFNILEPTTNKEVLNYDNCICLTPGVCFSSDGKRIGYGKGYYDRFFQSNNVYRIGLTYKECLDDKIEINNNDQKVNEVIYK